MNTNTNKIVVDASLFGSWFLEDENHETTEKTFDFVSNGGEIIVPTIFFWEVSNILNISLKRNRISASDVDFCVQKLSEFPIKIQKTPSLEILSDFSKKAFNLELSAYDFAYLALAQKYQIPLATLDKKLATKAKKTGLIVWD